MSVRWRCASVRKSAYNFDELTDPRIDEIISDAYAVMPLDQDKAVDLLIEADQIVMDQVPLILIITTEKLPGASVNLKGFQGFTDYTFMNPRWDEILDGEVASSEPE